MLVWPEGLLTVLRIGLPGQLVAPGETFWVTVTAAWPESMAADNISIAPIRPGMHFRRPRWAASSMVVTSGENIAQQRKKTGRQLPGARCGLNGQAHHC